MNRIFSGVQPSGNLHLGNYIGAIRNFVDLQNQKENECVYCVVDLHAITVKQDPKTIKNNNTTHGIQCIDNNANEEYINNSPK